LKRCSQNLIFAFKVPGLAPGLSMEELDEESELLAVSTGVSFILATQLRPHLQPVLMTVPQPLIPQVGLPIRSDPSTVYANTRHPAPDQGSVAALGRDLTPAQDRTPPLQSLPNIQQPNTSSTKTSQVLTKDSSSSNPWSVPSPNPTVSWKSQILSLFSAYQETQSSKYSGSEITVR